MLRIQDIILNTTLDEAAESEILGGCGWKRRRRGSWRLRKVIYMKRGIKKVFARYTRCGVRYKTKFIKYNFCGC